MVKALVALFLVAAASGNLAAQARPSVFAGTVVDSLQRPLSGAEVALPALSLTRLTDSLGQFRIDGVTPGAQRITVRRIGYGQLDTSIVFVEGKTTERRVTLGTIVRLDSVVVSATATRRDPLMIAFEENRAKGFGRFVAPVRIGKDYAEAREMQERTDNCLRSERVYHVPDLTEEKQGLKRTCYALVYLDNSPLNGSRPTMPFGSCALRLPIE